MKILHLATSMGGGAGRAAIRINTAQNLFGIEATIQSRDSIQLSGSDELTKLQISPFKQFESSTLTFLQSKLVQNSNDLVTPLSVSSMKHNDNDFNQYDVINLHATYNFLNSKNLMKLSEMNKPFVFTLHDQRNLTGGCHYSRSCTNYKTDCSSCPQVRNPWKHLVSNSFKSQSSAIKKFRNIRFVTPSNWLAKISENSAIGHGIKVSVINNPIPASYFAAQSERNANENLKIGFISAHLDNPFKGLDVLMRALDTLSSRFGTPYSLKLIGSGEKPKAGRSHRITQVVANSDEDVIKHLIDLDVLVVPSTEDNSPSVIGEALALGIRVIGSNVGGIPEILKRFGMPTFESRDSFLLAEHLSNLPASFNSHAIRAQAKRELSEEKIAEQYFDLYNSLIQK